jgi:hypothetical protein
MIKKAKCLIQDLKNLRTNNLQEEMEEEKRDPMLNTIK